MTQKFDVMTLLTFFYNDEHFLTQSAFLPSFRLMSLMHCELS